MTLANLILWIALLVNISLLVIVIFNKQQKHQKPILLLLSLITSWEIIELINIFWLRHTDYLLVGARFGLLPNLFLAPAFLWLVFSLCESCQSVKKTWKILVWLPAVIMTPFLFSNYNISTVTLTDTGFVFQQGILYVYFLIYFLLIIIFALYFLLRTRKHVNLIIKKQIDYIFFGTAVTALTGVLFSVVLPLLNIKSLFYIGVDSSVLFTMVLVYALSHDRFLDLRLAFFKGILDLLNLFIILAIYYLLFLLLSHLINVDLQNVVNQILFIIFVGLTSPWLYRFFYRLINLFFFNPNQNIQQAQNNIVETLRSTRDVNVLFSKLAKEISSVINYREFFVYLAKHNNPEVFHQVFPVGERLLNIKDSQLLQFLANKNKLIHSAEVEYWSDDKYLSASLQKQQIDLAVPIFYNQQLLGVLVINDGQKLLSSQQLSFMNNINKYLDIAIGSLLLANK